MDRSHDLAPHASAAARALVILQERHLHEFIAVWRRARAAELRLPETDDPSYESLESLMRHVVRASRFYVIWVAELLGLADPGIDPLPEASLDDATLDAYVEHLDQGWRRALVGARDEAMDDASRDSPWGTSFTADSMLEHAVMHPIRHSFQLEELMREQGSPYRVSDL